MLRSSRRADAGCIRHPFPPVAGQQAERKLNPALSSPSLPPPYSPSWLATFVDHRHPCPLSPAPLFLFPARYVGVCQEPERACLSLLLSSLSVAPGLHVVAAHAHLSRVLVLSTYWCHTVSVFTAFSLARTVLENTMLTTVSIVVLL